MSSETFRFFSDAGLTVPLVGGVTQPAGGLPVDRLIYFGSPASGKKLETVSNPGANPVQVEIFDSGEGEGVAVSAIKLALSFGGLDAATAGEPLTIGTTLFSGSSNAIAVYVRTDSGLIEAATYNDLSLQISDVVETDA